MEMKERKEAERRNQEDEDVEEWYSNYEVLLMGGVEELKGVRRRDMRQRYCMH